MNSHVYWHWPTFFMYILMGVLLACACNANNRYFLRAGVRYKLFNRRFIGVFIVWVFLGVFRLVDGYHGGTDTPSYILEFENAFNPNYYSEGDIAFQFLKMAVRYISSDYHVFFFVIYGIWMTVYLLFIKTFTTPRASTIPLVLLPYLFYVGFSSMRSNMGFSWLLLSLVCLFYNKYLLSIITGIFACFTHVTMMMYAPVLLFYFFFRNKNIKFIYAVGGIILFYCFGIVIQGSFLAGSFAFLQSFGSGVYEDYVTLNSEKTILDSYVIYFPSFAIGFAILVLWKPLLIYINATSPLNKGLLKALLLICLYDAFMAPVASTLGVYRSYEYLMLPRLLLWGVMIDVVRKYFRKIPSTLINTMSFIVFVVWIWGRYKGMYESSQLMPYILDLF